MQLKAWTSLLFILTSTSLWSQEIIIRGKVIDASKQPLQGVTIREIDLNKGTITNRAGNFKLTLPEKNTYEMEFSHIGYNKLSRSFSSAELSRDLWIQLDSTIIELEEVEIVDTESQDTFEAAPVIRVDAQAAQDLPSAFGDISKVLVTLPGVASNNELSTAYSVRGGNFDENLVYVNDIPIYRPFLANSGRQEGLSFVNPELTKDIKFYAGGWEAKYGDKLSSSLNIQYLEPNESSGSITLGLLGGSGYFGGKSKNDRIRFVGGARHKDSRYLLGTLEVEGQYFPKFTDFQAMTTFDLTKKSSSQVYKTKLNWLVAYGRNRYLTKPTSQFTEFGSVSQNFRLQTAFIGREILDYDTYQTGFNLLHHFNDEFNSSLIVSTVYTTEKEYFEVEGGYRLCDVDNNPGSATFDDCVVTRGIGTNFDYGRNELQAVIVNVENRYEWLLSPGNYLEGGIGTSIQSIDDEINEYTFIDSADYISVTYSTFNKLNLNSKRYYGFLQNTIFIGDSTHTFTYGVRANYWDENKEFLVSPRMQYRVYPDWKKATSFHFSAGLYQQPPFYRELRTYTGELREDLKAQKSFHLIAGYERLLRLWERPFRFTSELYYKRLSNIIAYDVDNLRLRYHANNNTKAFAAGFDTRIHGEFIRGTQSWFSLGVLTTRENLANDQRDYIRRPTDQRLKIGIFFEDHLPNDPTMRVYLNAVFGSGFPFGPPQNKELRGKFSGDEYYRTDIGFSKSFEPRNNKYLKTIWLRAEILNAFAADNTLSYTWIEDVNGFNFAVPNSLSARFLNIKLRVDF